MKVNYMISTAAVLAALLTFSCTKDLQENAPVSGKDSDKVTLLIAADEVTKTTFGDDYEVKWEDASDKIGLFIASSSTNVPASLTRNEAGKAYFEATVSEYASGDKLCAYYPYADKAGTDASKVTLKIPYIQTQAEANKFNGANNPMIAVPVALPSAENVTDGTVVIQEQLKFRHVGAILEFDITGVPSGEKLKSVQFVADGGFPATDNSVYDLTSVTENGDVNTVAGTYYKSVTVSLTDGGFQDGQSSKVYMTLVPGKYTGNIYISTDKNLYRYAAKIIEADRSEVKTIKADLSSGSADKSKEIKSALDYEVFAMAANAGDYSAWVDGAGEVKLGADISTTTYFTRIQKDWTGKFNGQKHTIKQDASVVPLFTVISEGASVSDLVLEGSKKSMANAGGYGSAAVAQINKGTIENVTNKMMTDLNVTGGSAIAGMVKCNGGTMRNCVQEGNITINAVIKATTTLYVGGIAAFASDLDEAKSSTKVGKFENCENKASIEVSRTSSGKFSIQKFAVGGICAIVHRGTKDVYPQFSGCVNSGAIKLLDKDKNAQGQAAVAGGIIGRVANYVANALIAVDVVNEGYYAKIENCSNSAVIENSAYSTGGFIDKQSGARVCAAGGIVGYASGLKANPVDIIGCTNTGQILGGYATGCLMGGICGQTNNVNIKNATVEAVFGDSSLDDHQLSAAGGVVGSSLNSLTVENSKVDISGSLTPNPVGIGVLQGFVRSGTPKYTGIQIRANLTYNKGAGQLEVTQENVETKSLYCTQTLTTSGITYWNNK